MGNLKLLIGFQCFLLLFTTSFLAVLRTPRLSEATVVVESFSGWMCTHPLAVFILRSWTEPNQGDNDWPKLKLGLCLFRTALEVMSWLHRRWPCLRYAFAGRPLTRVRDPYTGLFSFLLFLPVHALLAWYAAAAVVCATFVWHLRHRWTKGRRR